MTKINVTMFGGKSIFGGRERPLEAVVSYCEYAEVCPALKSGRCPSNNPRMDSGQCHHIKTTRYQGYTSRAKKYYEFKNKWNSDEKMSSVKNSLLSVDIVGNSEVVFNIPHISLEKVMEGVVRYDVNLSPSEAFYMDESELTVELLDKIKNSKPQAFFGGTIDTSKTFDSILLAIKEIKPELYEEYIGKSEYAIDYRGRDAYLYTLKGGITFGEWKWDGEHLISTEESYIYGEGVYGYGDFTVKPNKEVTVEVKSNDWVDSNTKFKE